MEELFRQYTAAFDAFNPQKIASLYRLPCAISDADGVQTFTERTELIQKFSANCKAMRRIGYQKAYFKVIEKQQLGSDKAAVTIAWKIITDDSKIEFRTLYICHQIESNWYVFSANVYEGDF